MKFLLDKAIPVLERTPEVLIELLKELPEEWTHQNEGENTWSPYDVLGHLIHGEYTDWVERTLIILSDRDTKEFIPFDRFAQFEISRGKTMNDLLNEFSRARRENITKIKSLNITTEQLDLKGVHPELGPVTMRNLLSSWVTHDMGHIAQITRVMAKLYSSEVGPWKEYIPVLNRK